MSTRTRLARAGVAAAIVVIVVLLVVAWWNLHEPPPPTGITPEDIRQMSVTERRVLGNCQLQKLGEEYDVIGADERAQESGHPLEYIWYKDGYWCDKQERHDFWTSPQND